MTIDFTEIAQANIANGDQDRFELFGREFLQEMGYRIEEHPDRGQDGGKDILAIEPFKTLNGQHEIKWCVSCKHKAHSGNSVGVSDEQNIRDRVEALNADGFMGFYSTLPSSRLNNYFSTFRDRIYIEHYDSAAIERCLTSNRALDLTYRNYLPASYARFMQAGGYGTVETSIPILEFELHGRPPNSPSTVRPKVKVMASVLGERIHTHVTITISESKYTHTLYNPALAPSKSGLTLYRDTQTFITEFDIPTQQERHPFFSIHAMIATDQGTFSQNSTIDLSGGGFRETSSSIMRRNKLILTRVYQSDRTPVDSFHH